MPTYGTKLASNPSTWVDLDSAALNQVAFSGDEFVAPGPGWITQFGVWMRRVNGTPKVYLGGYVRDSAGAPTTKLGHTGKLTVSASGGNAQGVIAASSTESATAIRLEGGQRFVPALILEGGDAQVGVVDDLGNTSTHYAKTVAPGLPTDPFNPSVQTADQPRVAFWFDFTPDAAPNAPTALTPANGATVTGSPTFSGTFTDPNTGAPIRDKMRAYQIEVVLNSDPTYVLWGGAAATFLATDLERVAATTGRFTQAYNGEALAGRDIRWRAWVQDDAGTWSQPSAYQVVTINAGSQVTPTAPTGKVESSLGTLGYAGTYHDPDGDPSSHIQVRIRDEDGAILKVGAERAKIVASAALPGTAFTLNATEAGIGRLQEGRDYYVQMRAKSGGIWGLWSAPVAFRTNSVPSIPTNPEPPSGDRSTAYPVVRWRTRDRDDDDVEGVDTDSTFRFVWPNGTVHDFTVTDYDQDEGEFYLQTTGTHMPVSGTYKLQANHRDISAAESTSEFSQPVFFTKQTGPTVTVTSPAQGGVLERIDPFYTFTVAGGTLAKAKVDVYKADSETRVYNGPWKVTSVGEIKQPEGWLNNGTSYDLVVTVETSTGVVGSSLRRRFRVAFTAPFPVTNPRASAKRNPRDPSPTSVLFSWDPSDLPLDEFGGYVVRRRYAGQDHGDAVRIKTIRNVGHSFWNDHHAPSGRNLTYSVTQLRRVGGKTVESNRVEADIELNLRVVVIASAEDGDVRSVLRWKPAKRSGKFNIPRSTHVPWGTRLKPVVVRGRGNQELVNASYTIISDPFGTKEQHLDNLMRLYLSQEKVSYRDETRRFFGSISDFGWTVEDNRYDVSLSIEEIDYTEGEEDD